MCCIAQYLALFEHKHYAKSKWNSIFFVIKKKKQSESIVYNYCTHIIVGRYIKYWRDKSIVIDFFIRYVFIMYFLVKPNVFLFLKCSQEKTDKRIYKSFGDERWYK